MNNVCLVGRLTKDPSLRYSGQGTAITRFTLAVDRIKKGETDFLNCVCFNKTAENVANHLAKGRLVGIQGSIQTGSYEKDGAKVYTTDIIANTVQYLDRAKAEPDFGVGGDDVF